MYSKLFVSVEYCLLFLFCCSDKMFYLSVLLVVFLIIMSAKEFVIIQYYVNLFISEYPLLSIVI